MNKDTLARLRRRAHVHVGSYGAEKQPPGSCYSSYEPCGEHHAHDDRCGSRLLSCGLREDRDLVDLLAAHDELAGAAAARESWTTDPQTGHANMSPLYEELARRITQHIKDSARALLEGHALSVARGILAELAHVHGLAPGARPRSAATRATGEALAVYDVAHDEPEG